MNDSVKESQNMFVSGAFKLSIKYFKIRFFPASKPRTGSAGAPNSRPVFNSWGNLGYKDEDMFSIEDPSPLASRPTVPPETIAFNNVIERDCNAEWSANTLTLKTIKRFLNKTSLPKDFVTPSRAEVKYVDETYSWVRLHYNGTKPLHHLALLVAIIVASSLLPDLFVPTGLKPRFLNANSAEDVRKLFDDVDWVSKGKKGMTDRSIFIAMFTTFIIAIYEKDSPLRKHMELTTRRGLGDPWTSKHCQHFLSFSPFHSLFFLFLAVKGVNYTTLVRLGIVWGKGPGAYEKGLFGQSWGCHPPDHILLLYNTLCRKLRELPFGPFDALSLLIGDKNARVFCGKDGLDYSIRPPSLPVCTSQTDRSEYMH